VAESNVDIGRRGFEAALSGDLDAIREFLDPEVKWHGGAPSAAGACTNREQALEFSAARVAVGASASSSTLWKRRQGRRDHATSV